MFFPNSPTPCSFSLIKQTKALGKATATTKESPKEIQTNQKMISKAKNHVHRHLPTCTQPWSPFCVVQLVGVKSAVECSWYAQWRLYWRKLVGPFLLAIHCKELLGMGWSFVSTSSLWCRDFSGLSLCRFCAYTSVPMGVSPVVSGRYSFLWFLESCYLLFSSWALRGGIW